MTGQDPSASLSVVAESKQMADRKPKAPTVPAGMVWALIPATYIVHVPKTGRDFTLDLAIDGITQKAVDLAATYLAGMGASQSLKDCTAGGKDNTAAECAEMVSTRIAKILTGTIGESGFGSSLEAVFKAARNKVASKLRITKEKAKAFPDWDAVNAGAVRVYGDDSANIIRNWAENRVKSDRDL